MSTARLHHYVPQGYLAAFTNNGTKKGRFWVMDVGSEKYFCTSPKNVCVERDFNRVDMDDQPIDGLESALASFEDEAIGVIRNISQIQTFPDDVALNVVLNFICLMAVRNPRLRESFNNAREQTLHILNDILVSDRRIFESQMRRATEAGYISDKNVSYEELRDFIEKRKYTVEFCPQDNSKNEFKTFDKLLPIFGLRTWSLLLTPQPGIEFICSDHPVTLFWKDRRSTPVGFGRHQTEIFVPLSPDVGLYGTFEDPLPLVVRLTDKAVAAMNGRSFVSAKRHVFSRINTFSIKHEEGHIRDT